MKLKLTQEFNELEEWVENPYIRQEILNRFGAVAGTLVPSTANVRIFTDGKRQYMQLKGFTLDRRWNKRKDGYRVVNILKRIDYGFYNYLNRRPPFVDRIYAGAEVKDFFDFTRYDGDKITALAQVTAFRQSDGTYHLTGRHLNQLQKVTISATLK